MCLIFGCKVHIFFISVNLSVCTSVWFQSRKRQTTILSSKIHRKISMQILSTVVLQSKLLQVHFDWKCIFSMKRKYSKIKWPNFLVRQRATFTFYSINKRTLHQWRWIRYRLSGMLSVFRRCWKKTVTFKNISFQHFFVTHSNSKKKAEVNLWQWL